MLCCETITLINSYCVPILLFSLEAVDLRKRDILRLINAYNQCFHKVFNTWDRDVIKQCQSFMSLLPMDLLLVVNKFNFLVNKSKSMDHWSLVYHKMITQELNELCSKYNVVLNVTGNSKNFIKESVWNFFLFWVT